MLKHLPQTGRAIVTADTEAALEVENHREKQGQADGVVQESDGEMAADAVGFEIPAVEGIEEETGDADGVGDVAEAALTHFVNARSYVPFGKMRR